MLYEGKYKPKKDEKIVPVCVFVGKDEAGKIKFACMRGIYEQVKKDVYGSDKEERRLRQRQGVQLLLAAGETAQQSGRRL